MIARQFTLGLTMILLSLPSTDALAGDAAIAIEWNETVLKIAEAEDGFLTLKGLRTVTMMHIAMHDSLSAIHGDYETYAFDGSQPSANPNVAVSQAAFVVAANQYPDKREIFVTMRDTLLQEASSSESFQTGMQLGNATAHAILADREGDGWDAETEYRWHPMAPGVYAEFQEHSGTPQGFVFGAGWAKARGFALELSLIHI